MDEKRIGIVFTFFAKPVVAGIKLEGNKSIKMFLKDEIDNSSMTRMGIFNFGEYSEAKDSYSIHKPVLVSFILYPSGNWKIEEI